MSAVYFLLPHWKLMRTNRHLFSLVTYVFLLHYMEIQNYCACTLHRYFSLATHGQVETKQYCACTDILQFTLQVFLRHQHVQWFLQLLNQLHAFVSRWVHCFLYVLKSVVVILFKSTQHTKCLERGKLQMSSWLCLHKWLEKIFAWLAMSASSKRYFSSAKLTANKLCDRKTLMYCITSAAHHVTVIIGPLVL